MGPSTFTVTFDLSKTTDSDGLNLCRHGDYFVRATSETDPDVYGDSSDFRIAVVSVEKFRSLYLFGLPNIGINTRKVKFQPTQITGVKVASVSNSHAIGAFTLTYNYISNGPVRQLSWKGGPVVPINGPGTYVLTASSIPSIFSSVATFSNIPVNDYIVVEISDVNLLPTTNRVDTLLVELDSMC